MAARVLIIAGSDPSGGAGVQADIKTVTALGGYAAAALTALTVQNTKGVSQVRQLPADFIRDQIVSVLDDVGADAIKIGMIGDAAAAHAVADALAPVVESIPIVLDPVLVATSGDALAAEGVVEALRGRLIPMATLITPNTDEATALSGVSIADPSDLERAARCLCAGSEAGAGARAALVKGGHLKGETLVNALAVGEAVRRFETTRLPGPELHGTGCTLASAVAAYLAKGRDLEAAVEAAMAYVHEAIRTAPAIGGGARPLNHAHPLRRDD